MMWDDSSQLLPKLPSYTKRKIATLLALLSLCATLNSLVWQNASIRPTPPPQQDDDSRPSTTRDWCASRAQRYGLEPRGLSCQRDDGRTCVAVVVTVNMGFFDFFENWYRHYRRSGERSRLLVVVAQDSQIYRALTSHDSILPRDGSVEVVLGDGSEAQSSVAEGYGTKGYRTLVSGRATHLLNVICGLEQAGSSMASSSILARFNWGTRDASAAYRWIVIYTDIDAVWLQDPVPLVLSGFLDSTKRALSYDLLAAIDERDNSMGFETYYCTGFLAIADTPASLEFLSRWEKELEKKPTLNQPIFNHLLVQQQQLQQQQQQESQVPPLIFAGLSETQFVSGKFWDSADPNDKDIAVLHNNFIKGADEKRRRFREKGMWMQPSSSPDSGMTRGSVDNDELKRERPPGRVSYVTSFWAEPREAEIDQPKNMHRREIEAALLVNLHNPHLDQIVVFLDGVSKAGTTCHDFLQHMRALDDKIGMRALERMDPFSKLSCVDIPGDQPNYFQMFNITQHEAVVGDIIVLSNADQVFDDSVSMAHHLNPEVLVVLGTRGFPMDEIPPIIQHFYITLVGEDYLPKQEGTQKKNADDNMCATNPYSWDTWIFHKSNLRGRLKEEPFQRPLANKKMVTFSMNEMGAENAALWALQQTFPFSSLYNACDKIRSWSFHLTPKTHKVHETPWPCGKRARNPCGSVPYPWGGVPLKGRPRRAHPGVPKDPACVYANNCFLQELIAVEDATT